MTIIFSNNMDPDCQVIKQAWQGLKDINLVEITPDTDDYEDSVNNAIIAEDDKISFAKDYLYQSIKVIEDSDKVKIVTLSEGEYQTLLSLIPKDVFK